MKSSDKGVDAHERALEALRTFREEVDVRAASLASRHAARLQCRAGCAQCCRDELTVREVEAEAIRRAHPEVLASEPHSAGACAFLDEADRCRIYEERPYICRSQGLPLRWFDSTDEADPVRELRDICPLNLDGEPIESLPDDACWLLGPYEARLEEIASDFDGERGTRVRLRDLFSQRG